MDDILRGGMAFLQAQQSGGGGLQAVVDGLIAGSPLGESPARAQSAQLIAHSILAKAEPLLKNVAGKIGAKKTTASGSRSTIRATKGTSRPKGRAGRS